MSERSKKRLVQSAVTAAVGALIAYLVFQARGGLPDGISAQECYRILSDTFTVPGILLLLSAGMVLVANNGALDGIGFIMSRTVCRLIPGRALSAKHETYGEYLERKHGEKRSTGCFGLVTVGAAFLAVGLVFMYLFYRAYA